MDHNCFGSISRFLGIKWGKPSSRSPLDPYGWATENARMKTFAVTADVELVRKPQWFDGFRAEYDDPYPLHVTLKQPSLVEDGDVEGLKKEVADFFAGWGKSEAPIGITFDRMNVSVRSKEDICVMLDATDTGPLATMQAGIVARLGTRYPYRKEEYARYESNFHPHVTIARDLTEKDYGSAAKIWTPDFACEGFVKSCTLVIVPLLNAEEANKPENRTTFAL